MASQPRMTNNTLKVLNAIMAAPARELAGADIGRATKLATGTLYPILMRIEAAGWIEGNWEALDPRMSGHPRRRFYRVTGLGATRARAELRALGLASAKGVPAWET